MVKALYCIILVVCSTTLSTAQAQFVNNSELQKTLNAFDHANDFHEWNESAWHVSTLAQRLKPFVADKDFAPTLCTQLLKLKFNHLSAIIDFIKSDFSYKNLHCQKALLDKYNGQMMRSKLQIMSQVAIMELNNKFTSSTLNSALPPNRETLGPSEEMDLNVSVGPVLFHSDLPIGTLALTFDDGPHPEHTPTLLRILEKEKVQANFFLVGKNVSAYPEVVKQTSLGKHAIGGHSQTHADLRRLSLQNGLEEIYGGLDKIISVLGWTDPYFRFPYGARTKDLQANVSKAQVGTFFWNIDTLDWKKRDPDELFNYALAQIEQEKRGIVLFHDIQPQTISIMPELLKALRIKGYKLVVFRSPEMKRTPNPRL